MFAALIVNDLRPIDVGIVCAIGWGMKPRLAGNGPTEIGQRCNYFKVLITYAQYPSTCIKVAADNAGSITPDVLRELSPFYDGHSTDAVSVRVDDCNQFQAVLHRNI